MMWQDKPNSSFLYLPLFCIYVGIDNPAKQTWGYSINGETTGFECVSREDAKLTALAVVKQMCTKELAQIEELLK